MAKSKRRQKAMKSKADRKARSMSGGGQSRYAKKRKGGGNTSPNGMWEIVPVD